MRALSFLVVPLALLFACDTEAPTVPGAIDRNDVEGPDFSDARFLDRMSAHHHRAIALASLATERARNPELRALGTTLHAARHAELYEMLGWGETWFRDRPSRSMAHIASTNEEIARIEQEPDVDRALLDALERNHLEGLEFARDGQLEADHPEVRTLAEKIVAENGAQLKQIRTWRLAWSPGETKPVEL